MLMGRKTKGSKPRVLMMAVHVTNRM